jgi:hypothetical protein
MKIYHIPHNEDVEDIEVIEAEKVTKKQIKYKLINWIGIEIVSKVKRGKNTGNGWFGTLADAHLAVGAKEISRQCFEKLKSLHSLNP